MNSSSQNSLRSSLEVSSSYKTFILPEKCFEKRVACTWRRGNQFILYPRSQSTKQSQVDVSEDTLVNIRQDIMLFTPLLRKLVNESNGTFIALQNTADSIKTTDNQVEFLKISRQYRSVIRVCIESLQEAAANASDEYEKNTYLSNITIFYSIECIWHLCEILYIDNVPGDIVLPYLLEWVRFHFPCHEQTAAQLLEACERGSETNSHYWETVVGMVVQGRVDVARALLKLHSDCDTNDFKLVDNCLRTMPVYSVYGGISSGEFTITWKHWQAECRAKLNMGKITSNPNLELILRLITGDYAAFESVRPKYGSWRDLLGGWVLFTNPTTRRHELSAAAAACSAMRHTNRNNALDEVLRALVDGDLHQVIQEIQQVSDNGWFATHLTDLLFHCGKLKIVDKYQNNVTQNLRDSLILEYGSLLMEHQSLWTAGISYLNSCLPEGAKRAELLLEHLPIKTEAKAMRIIAEAKKHNLHSVVHTVSSCMGAKYMSSNRLGAALAWAIRGRNSTLAGRIADKALHHYSDTGSLPATDLLLTIGSNMLLHDRLVFLGKYCEFHRLYKNRDLKNAGKLLISLLTSKITPEYFWTTLLMDTLPLLESDTPILSSEATCETMAILALKENSLSQEKADLLRLALVRNLAKAALLPSEE